MKTAARVVLALITSTSLSAFAGDHASWGYVGADGPEHWGKLGHGFAMCDEGRNQSPLDLRSTVHAELPALSLDYPLLTSEILNNGHTVQVNFAPGGTLDVKGRRFELKQVHFHTPSENRIDGKSFAAEAHLVHADEKGNLAVVAIMVEEGAPNPALEAIDQAAPNHAGDHHGFADGQRLSALLPERRDYLTYSGSLTTPPCTEGVLWVVLKQPTSASRTQIATLSQLMHGPNNRPVQPLNARLILE